MARIEDEALRAAPLVELGADDVAAGLALSAEAGWNQTGEDWSMMIRLGRAFGVADSGRRLVATALALPYPPDFGWISMVLVHSPWRRRGLGTRLLERSLGELEGRGLVPLLDATPAGQAVYEGMGFQLVETLTRWRGHGRGRTSTAHPDDARGLDELDRAAFGADRSAILEDLLGRKGALFHRDPAGEGFLLSRPGRTATYVGPVVAGTTDTAVELFEAGLAAISGPVVIDVPDRESDLTELLSRQGFRPERPFTRMALGRDTGFGRPALVRAIAGPELG